MARIYQFEICCSGSPSFNKEELNLSFLKQEKKRMEEAHHFINS